MLGNLEILRILHFKFGADFCQKTDRGLTPLHCASQKYEGIVSIYFLKSINPNFNPNVIDIYGASPLHYAIMALEENNIQALLSLGADINQRDNSGSSMLHVAIVRYVEDQENFGIYKEVVKELLQFGAQRDVKNNAGLNPYSLVESLEDRIILKEEADYNANGV